MATSWSWRPTASTAILSRPSACRILPDKLAGYILEHYAKPTDDALVLVARWRFPSTAQGGESVVSSSTTAEASPPFATAYQQALVDYTLSGEGEETLDVRL